MRCMCRNRGINQPQRLRRAAPRQRYVAVGVDRESRIVGDFPEMAVGIGEIAVPAAPEGALRRLDDAAAGLLGRRQNLVDLGIGARVVGEIDRGRRLCRT